jgi:hypothetical protein
MKSSLILAGAMAAPLCWSTAMAGDTPSSFHALSGLSNSAHVAAMTNDQLATVQGGTAKKGKRVNQSNTATCGGTGIAALNCVSVLPINLAIGGSANQASGSIVQSNTN